MISNIDNKKIEARIKGISHTDTTIPTYCEAATIEKHGHNLVRLFDYNFGRDWACFLNLFYWEKYGKHHIKYQNPHEKEDNKEFYLLRRKAYYCLAKKIIECYFKEGYDFAKNEIFEDKMRMKWSETPDRKDTLRIWISSDFYDSINKK